MAQGMVIDPVILTEELKTLTNRGLSMENRIFLSNQAHIILPYHILVDTLRENAGQAIGTTKRGIGPVYEDKVARRGLPAGYLKDMDKSYKIVSKALDYWAPFFVLNKTPYPGANKIIDDLCLLAKQLVPLLTDTSMFVTSAIDSNKSVLFEGAQGTLLDIDHGTYPFVTSSSAVAGGVCTGVGIGPHSISHILGVTKAYITRVGGGPFPTELDSPEGEHMKKVGMEFGSVTGRPRRVGWLDIPALKYAIRINGLNSLAITKLDVLTGIDPLRVCVEYDTPDGRSSDFPIKWIDKPDMIKPVYENLSGWTKSICEDRKIDDLPSAAIDYIKFIEYHARIPCNLISVGPSREALIENNQC
jgi:adenylosuccinate synthase